MISSDIWFKDTWRSSTRALSLQLFLSVEKLQIVGQECELQWFVCHKLQKKLNNRNVVGGNKFGIYNQYNCVP